MSVEPLQGVVITSREIYDAVVRLTGRVDVLIDGQGRITEDVKDHEGRLRSLEATRWPLPTLAVIIALATAGLSVADKIFG
jgi:hypothetical protein